MAVWLSGIALSITGEALDSTPITTSKYLPHRPCLLMRKLTACASDVPRNVSCQSLLCSL